MKQKLSIFFCTTICLLILAYGCHLDATYVRKATVYSITETEICFEELETGEQWKCYATTENIKLDDNYFIKFDNKATESDRYDDGLIDFGKHCICGIVF